MHCLLLGVQVGEVTSTSPVERLTWCEVLAFWLYCYRWALAVQLCTSGTGRQKGNHQTDPQGAKTTATSPIHRDSKRRVSLKFEVS